MWIYAYPEKDDQLSLLQRGREELHAYSEHVMSYKLLIIQPLSEQDLLSGEWVELGHFLSEKAFISGFVPGKHEIPILQNVSQK